MSQFSDDAIGYYLQAEDQASPKLKKLLRNYVNTIDEIEDMNKRLYRKTTKLINSIADAPIAAAKAVRDTVEAMGDVSIPLNVKINTGINQRSVKAMTSMIRSTVLDALSSMKLRLSPTVPARRSGLFESGSIRSQYKQTIQPPDYKGSFIPKYAEGGHVDPQRFRLPGVDRILAWLTRGEYVLTPNQTQSVNALAQQTPRASVSPPPLPQRPPPMPNTARAGDALSIVNDALRGSVDGIKRYLDAARVELRDVSGRFVTALPFQETIAQIQTATEAARYWNDVASQGPNPQATEMYEQSVSVLNNSFRRLDRMMSTLSEDSFESLNGAVNGLRRSTALYNDLLQTNVNHQTANARAVNNTAEAVEDLTEEIDDLCDVAGRRPARDGILEVVRDNRMLLAGGAGLSAITNQLSGIQNQLGGNTEVVQSFADSMNSLNQRMHLTRPELRAFSADILKATSELKILPSVGAGIVRAFSDMGVNSREEILKMFPSAAMYQEAMGVSEDMATKLVYITTQKLGLLPKNVDRIMVDIADKLSDKSGVVTGLNADQLITSLNDALAEMSPVLTKFNTSQKQMIASGLADLAASTNSVFTDTGDDFIKLFQEAATGNEQAGMDLVNLFGVNIDEALSNMASGKGLGDMLSTMQGRIGSMYDATTGSIQAQSMQVGYLKDAFQGLSGTALANVSTSNQLVGNYQKLVGATDSSTDATARLSEMYQNNLSMWDKFKTKVANTVASLTGLGVAGFDVLDFMQELGPLTPYLTLLLWEMGRPIRQMAVELVAFPMRRLIALTSRVGNVRAAATAASVAASVTPSLASNVAANAVSAAGRGPPPLPVQSVGFLGRMLGGTAQGLRAFANPQVAIGAAVVTAAISGIILAIGGAIRIAGPAVIESFGNAVGKMLEQMRGYGDGEAGKIGKGMIWVGAGLVAFSGALAIAGPLFLAGGTSMALASWALGMIDPNNIHETLGGLLNAFDFPTGKMARAAANAAMGGVLMAAVTGFMVAGAVGGLLSIPIGIVDWVGRAFNKNGIFAPFMHMGDRVAQTIDGIADSFSGLDAGKMNRAAKTAVPALKLMALTAVAMGGMSLVGNLSLLTDNFFTRAVGFLLDGKFISSIDRFADRGGEFFAATIRLADSVSDAQVGRIGEIKDKINAIADVAIPMLKVMAAMAGFVVGGAVTSFTEGAWKVWESIFGDGEHDPFSFIDRLPELSDRLVAVGGKIADASALNAVKDKTFALGELIGAYMEFGKQLVKVSEASQGVGDKYKNGSLWVSHIADQTRKLGKHGIPGLELGFIIETKDKVNAINELMDSYIGFGERFLKIHVKFGGTPIAEFNNAADTVRELSRLAADEIELSGPVITPEPLSEPLSQGKADEIVATYMVSAADSGTHDRLDSILTELRMNRPIVNRRSGVRRVELSQPEYREEYEDFG